MGWTPIATETHNTAQYSARTTAPNICVLHHGATTDAGWIISVESSGSKQVSSHCVVKDRRIAGIVQEQFRAWSLSDAYWDSRAFTVECANESTNGWTISDASHESLARLVANWASRYGFYPHRNGNPKTWTVIGHREVYTIYGGSYATACPGGMDLARITARAQQILAGGGLAAEGYTLLEEDMPLTDADAQTVAKTQIILPAPWGQASVAETLASTRSRAEDILTAVNLLTRMVAAQVTGAGLTPEQLQAMIDQSLAESRVIDYDALAAAIVKALPSVQGLTKADVVDAIKSVSYRAQ